MPLWPFTCACLKVKKKKKKCRERKSMWRHLLSGEAQVGGKSLCKRNWNRFCSFLHLLESFEEGFCRYTLREFVRRKMATKLTTCFLCWNFSGVNCKHSNIRFPLKSQRLPPASCKMRQRNIRSIFNPAFPFLLFVAILGCLACLWLFVWTESVSLLWLYF